MAVMREVWRSLRVGAWLGWQNESNWTSPWLFLIYSVVKPMAGALILLVMYLVVARTDTRDPLFAYLYLGNAFFTYVATVGTGVAWAVQEDREFFRIIKYVALSPVRYFWYLVGRALVRTVTATVSAALLIGVGIGILGIAVRWQAIRWWLFLPGFVLGLACCVATGLLLAAFLLVTPRKGQNALEAVYGLVYLLAGVIFPLDVLPTWVQPISRALPFTYWMESVRRGLVGGGLNRSLATLSDGQVLLRLALLTAGLCLVTVVYFGWSQQKVKALGLIDAATEW